MPFTRQFDITPAFLRGNQHLSVAALADLAGCSYSTMWRTCRRYQDSVPSNGDDEEVSTDLPIELDSDGAFELYTPKPRWSGLELQVLRDLLPTAGGRLLSRAINRSSSYLWRKAQSLGIPGGSGQRVTTAVSRRFWGGTWPNYLNRGIPIWISSGTIQTSFRFLVWPAVGVAGHSDCNHCIYRGYCQTSRRGIVACSDVYIGDLWSLHQGGVSGIQASVLSLAEYHVQLSYAKARADTDARIRSWEGSYAHIEAD